MICLLPGEAPAAPPDSLYKFCSWINRSVLLSP